MVFFKRTFFVQPNFLCFNVLTTVFVPKTFPLNFLFISIKKRYKFICANELVPLSFRGYSASYEAYLFLQDNYIYSLLEYFLVFRVCNLHIHYLTILLLDLDNAGFHSFYFRLAVIERARIEEYDLQQS